MGPTAPRSPHDQRNRQITKKYLGGLCWFLKNIQFFSPPQFHFNQTHNWLKTKSCIYFPFLRFLTKVTKEERKSGNGIRSQLVHSKAFLGKIPELTSLIFYQWKQRLQFNLRALRLYGCLERQKPKSA